MVYYEMTDGAGRMVAIENRSGIGWFNKVDWDRGLISDPWSTNSAAEVEARKKPDGIVIPGRTRAKTFSPRPSPRSLKSSADFR